LSSSLNTSIGGLASGHSGIELFIALWADDSQLAWKVSDLSSAIISTITSTA
jgi:hypothetical protein